MGDEVVSWRCGFCGAQTESQVRPRDACLQCGNATWSEVLRGHEGFGDSFRHQDDADGR